MPDRFRSSSAQTMSGETGRFGDSWGSGFVTTSTESCSDIVGSGDNAPFHVHREHWQGGIIVKPYTGFFSSYFNNYVSDLVRGPVIGHLGIDSPSTVAAASAAAARTNPSKPYVDVPVELAQVAEFVGILRGRGAGIIRQIANANLELQFGLLPVMEDLDNLLNLHDQIDRRVQQLHRLRAPRGLRRTIGIGTYSATERPFYWIQTQGLFYGQTFDVSTTETVRAHTRWAADDVSHLLSDSAMRALATRAVLGLTIDLKTAWELIPWSWLADYFSSIGDSISANRNIVGASLSDVSVMRHTVTHSVCPSGSVDGAEISAISGLYEDKTRRTSFAGVTADLNLLTGNQIGIIASIALTR